MYAAWEVGAWKALRHRFRPDIVVGASAGAWNGWAIASGCPVEELEAAWMDPALAAILAPSPHRRGMVRPNALFSVARDLFSRFRPRTPFGLTVVEVPRLRVRLVRDPEIRWEYLAATCSIPMVFPPVLVDGRRYVDGGLMGALPLWAAEEMGATQAVALNVLTSPLFHALRHVVNPHARACALPCIRLEPSTRLGSLYSAVRWSRDNVARWIDQGERDATRALRSITI
jgi:predicted acylesterase/phospholipase RssA